MRLERAQQLNIGAHETTHTAAKQEAKPKGRHDNLLYRPRARAMYRYSFRLHDRGQSGRTARSWHNMNPSSSQQQTEETALVHIADTSFFLYALSSVGDEGTSRERWQRQPQRQRQLAAGGKPAQNAPSKTSVIKRTSACQRTHLLKKLLLRGVLASSVVKGKVLLLGLAVERDRALVIRDSHAAVGECLGAMCLSRHRRAHPANHLDSIVVGCRRRRHRRRVAYQITCRCHPNRGVMIRHVCACGLAVHAEFAKRQGAL